MRRVMLRRCDVTIGIAGIAHVVLPLNLALNVLPGLLNILPSLDLVSTWSNITI